MNITEQLPISRAFLHSAINESAAKAHAAGAKDVLHAKSAMDLKFAFLRRSLGQKRRFNK